MKFKVGDQVVVTIGKDKGKKGTIIKVLPTKDSVIVEGMNLYTRNVKPYAGQPGQQVRRERPLKTAKVAIVNDKGERDRIGYQITKDKKDRIYKKTGKLIPEPKLPAKK